MATSYPVLMHSAPAAASLASNQFYAVTLESDGTVARHNSVTDVPFGVLQNTPASGKAAEVMVIGRTKVEFGETVTVGALIRFGANGKAYIFEVDVDITAYCAGTCNEGGDAGEIGMAMVQCCNPFRGEK